MSVEKQNMSIEEKPKEELPVDSSFNPLIINNDLKIGDKSCGNYSMNNDTIFQQGCD